MTDPIRIEFDDTRVVEALDRVIAAGGDLEAVLLSIGEELVESTIERFASETGPSGNRWKDNAQSTLKRYFSRVGGAEFYDDTEYILQGSKKRLRDEGFLSDDSINYQVVGNVLLIGSNRIQAAVMQLGARKGAFGLTARGGPIPWGDIPPRPFLGLSNDDEAAILDIVDEYLTGDL